VSLSAQYPILGFAGVLNSTSTVVIETMEQGGPLRRLAAARRLGITRPMLLRHGSWDSAAKAAALANVLLDADVTPQAASPRGITRLTPGRVQELARQGKTSAWSAVPEGQGRREDSGSRRVLDKHDVLASVPAHPTSCFFIRTSWDHRNGLDFAWSRTNGLWYFSDLVDIARTVGRI